jgi:hypothetical protein
MACGAESVEDTAFFGSLFAIMLNFNALALTFPLALSVFYRDNIFT